MAQIDTLEVRCSEKEFLDKCYDTYLYHEFDSILGISNYRINHVDVSKKKWDSVVLYCDSVKGYYPGNYIRFFSAGVLSKEGIWGLEFFTGYYKEYHRNGKLKMEGMLDEDGNSIGDWKSYNKKGRFKKVRKFS
jgi:hypothetical protein